MGVAARVAMKRKKSKFTGVYMRESKDRRYKGKPDICFDVTFKEGSRKLWQKVGWRSEGITAAYASKVRAEIMRKVRLGMDVSTPKPMTFGQAFKEYEENHLPTLKSGDRVTRLYNARLKDEFGDIKLKDISTIMLEKYKNRLLAEGLTPATTTHCLAIFRSVFKKMVSWEKYKGTVPTDQITMPKKDNRRSRFLKKNEADELLTSLRARSEDAYLMALTSLHTGMRFGEIANLRAEHISLNDGMIRIVDGKGEHSRTVFMTTELRYQFSQRYLKTGELIFPNRDGKIRSNISKSFPRTVKAMGLNDGIADKRDHVVFHSLRHTFASWLVQNGTALYTVSELLGHSSLEMTQRYSHLAPEVLKAAAASFDRIVGNG